MDDIQLILKIVLALCGAYLAFVSVGPDTHVHAPGLRWFRRLNRFGYGAIVATIALFGCGVANEYLDAEKGRQNDAARAELSERASNLAKQLEKSKKLVDETFALVKLANARNEIMDGILEKTEVVQARATIAFRDLGNGDVHTVNGQPIKPGLGDTIKWRLVCPRGNTWREKMSTGCGKGVVGRMGAYGSNFFLRAPQGEMPIFGRGPRRTLFYVAPEGDCQSVAEELVRQDCTMDVQHVTNGKVIALQKLEKRNFRYYDQKLPFKGDLCRAYELLYGEPCENAR